MNCFLTTFKGIEEIAEKEVLESGLRLQKKEDFVVFFEATPEELAAFTYLTRTARRICILLNSGEINSLSNIKIELPEFVKNLPTFKVVCEKVNSEVSSKEIEEIIGKKVNIKVDLNEPSFIIYVFINANKFYLGIDFAGFDLSKRDYKIYTFHRTMKGSIAYALARFLELGKDNKILDYCLRDGTFSIETARFFCKIPPHFYEKEKFIFKNFIKKDVFMEVDKNIKEIKPELFCVNDKDLYVEASKKNARIAAVHRLINFSKIKVDWLELKFKEDFFDRIITFLQKDENFIDEFFYQANYIAKNNAKILVIALNEDKVVEIAKRHSLMLERKIKIFQGNELLNIFLFINKKI